MSEYTYAAIDPGFEGSMAVLYPGDEMEFFDTPTMKVGTRRKYDIPAMLQRVLSIAGDGKNIKFALEDVHAVPKFGVVTSGELMRGVGIWQGILAPYPLTMIAPQRWKKAMMDGMGKEKDASRYRARQLFPQSSGWLERVKDHNRADALLMAAYLKRIS